jgi:hypothetical protein
MHARALVDSPVPASTSSPAQSCTATDAGKSQINNSPLVRFAVTLGSRDITDIGGCIRGLRYGIAIELAAAVVIYVFWHLAHLF